VGKGALYCAVCPAHARLRVWWARFALPTYLIGFLELIYAPPRVEKQQLG